MQAQKHPKENLKDNTKRCPKRGRGLAQICAFYLRKSILGGRWVGLVKISVHQEIFLLPQLTYSLEIIYIVYPFSEG